MEGLILGILQYVNSLIITNSITQNDWLLFFLDRNFPMLYFIFSQGCLHIPNFFILIMPETAAK